MKKMHVPMLDLKQEYAFMKTKIDAALKTCLDHQRWIFGPEVGYLEERVARYLGIKHCIGVSSGTDALTLALRALAIKTKGTEYFSSEDEIITTPFTFTATGDAIIRAGATPVFVDIDIESYNINVEEVNAYISSQPSNVVGIVPVHLYGLSCGVDKIMRIARSSDLFVVEDAAQAFGATEANKHLGAIGTAGAFSFFPSKNLGAFGDGGMVATEDGDVAEIISMLLRHGGMDKYNATHIGYNARLDTLQAAVLLEKINYIDEFNDRRRNIAKIYNEELSAVAALQLPLWDDSAAYHQYTVRTVRRDMLQAHLKERGIASMVYYKTPLHKMKVFGHGRSKQAGVLQNAEEASNTVLSLPIGPFQSEDETLYVVSAVKDFFL